LKKINHQNMSARQFIIAVDIILKQCVWAISSHLEFAVPMLCIIGNLQFRIQISWHP